MNESTLEYFKRKLLEKQDSLTDMVQRTEEHGRETESETQDIADMALASYTKEFMFGKSHGDHQILRMIQEALERIKDHSYGVCTDCEEEIQFKRLEAVPWARHCIHCQSRREKRQIKDQPKHNFPIWLD
jgi:DnaK suppressor protein